MSLHQDIITLEVLHLYSRDLVGLAIALRNHEVFCL